MTASANPIRGCIRTSEQVERKWRAPEPRPWSTFRHAAHPGTKVPRFRTFGKGALPPDTHAGRKVERIRQWGATRTGSRPTELSYCSY